MTTARALSAAVAIFAAAGLACGETADESPEPARPASDLPVQLRLPVANTDGAYLSSMVIGVDHDPVDHGGLGWDCLAYDGAENFPRCYDQHDGTDYLLNGGFPIMDAELGWVVAAAPGTVVDTHDGEYDRCHADLAGQEIHSDGYPMQANYVILEHAEGWLTRYWHLKKDTVAVQVGDAVACGQPLGLIGSSGISAQPHLHFELQNPADEVIDPYAGSASQPESYWVQQEGLYGLPAELCAE